MVDLVPSSVLAEMEEWRAGAKNWKPHFYQEWGLKFLLQNGYGGLFLDPGMGKTSISLAAVRVLLQKKLIHRVLVTAPLRACYMTWPEEICSWNDFKDLRIALLHGANKDKVLRSLTPEHRICLINPEGIPWLMGDRKRVQALGADMLITDESSLWKNANSVRFKALRKHLHTFKRRTILTGSPRPRHYLDLFGQVFLMDMGSTLGTYVSHYRNRFFFPTGYQMREWELLPGADKEIDKLVAPMVLRLDGEDYLKLPKVLERTHRVELPPKARAEYDSIESSLMSTLFTAPLVNSASARAKCCQIANGAVYLDSDPEEHWYGKNRASKVVHTAKVEAVVDLVNELQGEPLLLGIGYHHDVDAIRNALGKDIPCINSKTSKKQAAEFIAAWNKGLLTVLMGHPASMGHALNMQKFHARHVGYYDIPDNYDTYDQFYRRVRRQGNNAAFVMRHHFVAASTVDVVKMRNLRAKNTGQKAFLDAMKKYSEERRKKKGVEV